MKLKKLLALLMMLCMIMCCCVACSSDSDDEDEDDKRTEQSSDDKDDDSDDDANKDEESGDDDANKDDESGDDDANKDDESGDDDANKDDESGDDDANKDDESGDDDANKDDESGDDDAGLGDDSGATDDIEGEWTMEVDYADLLYTLLEVEVEAELILPLIWDFEDDGTYTLVCEDVPSEDEITAFGEAYADAALAWTAEYSGVTVEELKDYIIESGEDWDTYYDEAVAGCVEEVQGICEGFEESVGGTWELDGTTINLDTVDYLEVEIDGDTMTIVDASTDLAMFVGAEFTR